MKVFLTTMVVIAVVAAAFANSPILTLGALAICFAGASCERSHSL